MFTPQYFGGQNQTQTNRGEVTTVTPVRTELRRFQEGEPSTTEFERLKESVTVELKAIRSKFHSATSSAPEIDRLVAETGRTPFAKNITDVFIGDAGKVRLPRYNGTSNPKAYILSFRIAMGRAMLTERE